MCRFKGTASFFSEFMEHAALEATDMLQGMSATGSAQRGKVMSAGDISALIRTAAAYVLGAPVADDEPLSGAGLDSLGEQSHPHPACYSCYSCSPNQGTDRSVPPSVLAPVSQSCHCTACN